MKGKGNYINVSIIPSFSNIYVFENIFQLFYDNETIHCSELAPRKSRVPRAPAALATALGLEIEK